MQEQDSWQKVLFRDVVLPGATKLAWIFIGLIAIGTVIGLYQRSHYGMTGGVKLTVKWMYGREDNLFSPNRHYLNVVLEHQNGDALTGTYTIRAYGKFLDGRGGEASGESRNFQCLHITNAPPGDDGGVGASFYFNRRMLPDQNMSVEALRKRASVYFLVTFEGVARDGQHLSKAWMFQIHDTLAWNDKGAEEINAGRSTVEQWHAQLRRDLGP